MGKIKLFIDFDDTLFRTSDFKEPLFDMIAKVAEVDRADVDLAYKAPDVDDKSLGGYLGPRVHLEYLLRQRYPDYPEQDIEKLTAGGMERIENLIRKESKNYVFDGVSEAIGGFGQSEQFEPVLITVGDPCYQKLKVDYSGVGNYFGNVEYVQEENKVRRMLSLCGELEPFVLLDNSDREVGPVNNLDRPIAACALGVKVTEGRLPSVSEIESSLETRAELLEKELGIGREVIRE